MTALPYPLYDADNHLYETAESYLRHLPKKFARDIQFVQVNGRTRLAIGGQITEYMPNPTFDVVAAPGSHEKWYRADNPESLTLREMQGPAIHSTEAFRSGAARLKTLDQQGLQASLVYPTMVTAVEHRLSYSPEATNAVFHSLNEWLAEEWGFAREGRLFTIPVISLTDVDAAVKELDHVLAKGARGVAIRPAPVPGLRGGRSPGWPEFDPFWARVSESGAFVVIHASDSGYDLFYRMWTGGGNEWLPWDRSDPLQGCMELLFRAISDAVAALVCHGVFDRHPNVRVLAVENGSGWVEPLFESFKRVYGQMPKAFKRHPIETFRKHVYVVPFYEENVTRLAELISVERVLFGSDYPHPEGLAEPLDFLKELKSFNPAQVQRIMSTNLKELLEGTRQ